MAPDLNSVPESPRSPRGRRLSSNSTSRRASQMGMGPPPLPLASPGGTVPTSTHHSYHSVLPPPRRLSMSNTEESNMGVPLRHPRPLTAAELHLELEKEQEAVVSSSDSSFFNYLTNGELLRLYTVLTRRVFSQVNRLTRELSALRAQRSASVASNTSTSSIFTAASLLPIDPADPNPTHNITGPTHPTPSRRHRSSSSLSARSLTTPSTSASVLGSSTIINASGAASVPLGGGISQASADRASAAGAVPGATSLSRHNSIQRSGTSTPALAHSSSDMHYAQSQSQAQTYHYPHRGSLSSQSQSQHQSQPHQQPNHNYAHHIPFPPNTTGPHPLPSPSPSPRPSISAGTSTSHRAARSPSLTSALSHYQETALHRSELEAVKAENEALRQRVRALERALRGRREGGDGGSGGEARVEGGEKEGAGEGEGEGEGERRERGRARRAGEEVDYAGGDGEGEGDDEGIRVGESAQSAGLGRFV